MRPNIQLTREVCMRVGDFHIVDALRGVVDGDGKYNGRSGGGLQFDLTKTYSFKSALKMTVKSDATCAFG